MKSMSTPNSRPVKDDRPRQSNVYNPDGKWNSNKMLHSIIETHVKADRSSSQERIVDSDSDDIEMKAGQTLTGISKTVDFKQEVR